MRGKKRLPTNVVGFEPHLRVKVEPKNLCDSCRKEITGVLFFSKGKQYCEDCWDDHFDYDE